MLPAGMLNRRLIASLVLLLVLPCLPAWAGKPELKVYLWENYLDPEVIQRFEASHDVHVNIITFDNDDQREETLLATQGKGLDIICLNDVYMRDPASLGWLAELDARALPNLKYVEYPFARELPEAQRYAVPYFWGTLGIAFRADMMATPPSAWQDLFTLAPRFSGKVLQPSTMRLLVGIALLASGKDFNSENPLDLQEASLLLLAQAPHLFGYQTFDLSDANPLLTGAAVMAPTFNGDMLTLQGVNSNIRYVYPKEGAHVWVDYLAVNKDSLQQALAFKFLNFLNTPDIALLNARYVNFATPNLAAKALADDEYRNNPIIYPPAEAMQNTHLMRPLSRKAQHLQTAIYVRTLSHFESLMERP